MKSFFPIFTIAFFLATVSLAIAHPGAHATLEYLSARIANEPGNATVYYQRGVAYSQDGQHENALRDLQYAATLGDLLPVEFQLGLVYYRMQNLTAARGRFDSYLEAQPDNIAALQYRAKLLVRLGDTAGAIRDYKHIFALPGQVDPVDYMAASSLLLESPPYSVDAAIAILDQGMQRLGTVPQLQQRGIELELSQGRYDNAINRQQSLAFDTNSGPFWQVEMGHLLRAAGRTDQAYRYFAAAQRQLADLRKTPARVQLSQELQSLTQTALN